MITQPETDVNNTELITQRDCQADIVLSIGYSYVYDVTVTLHHVMDDITWRNVTYIWFTSWTSRASHYITLCHVVDVTWRLHAHVTYVILPTSRDMYLCTPCASRHAVIRCKRCRIIKRVDIFMTCSEACLVSGRCDHAKHEGSWRSKAHSCLNELSHCGDVYTWVGLSAHRDTNYLYAWWPTPSIFTCTSHHLQPSIYWNNSIV